MHLKMAKGKEKDGVYISADLNMWVNIFIYIGCISIFISPRSQHLKARRPFNVFWNDLLRNIKNMCSEKHKKYYISSFQNGDELGDPVKNT